MRPVSPAAFAETVAPGPMRHHCERSWAPAVTEVDLLLSTVRCEVATQVIPVNT